MRLSNPIILLLVLVAVNALSIVLIAFNSRAAIAVSEDKMRVLFLCALGFLGSASVAVVLGSKLISAFIEPMELAASKMLAVVGETDANAKAKNEGNAKNNNAELPDLAEKLITELETAKQRERLIADYSSDMLCCLDEQRRILDLNVQSETVLEYPIISLLASPLDSLIHVEDKEEYLRYFAACKIQNENKPLEARVVSRSGKQIDLEWQIEWSPSLSQYYCLARNITDRKENQRLKAEITAMVGHDLRAPASSLSFLLDNLRAGTFGVLPKEASDKLDKASDNVTMMLKLINQLLDAEKLECGQMEVDLKIIPLSELYESCEELLGDLAERRKIKLVFPEESSTIVMADFDRTVQVLCNLLSNAIKWSPEESRVEITEAVDGKMMAINVTDKGPGIAADRQQAIFERFKSSDQRADKSLASSGLGLYIAKKLIELQGGTVSLKSKLGEGSTFSISFKAANPADLPGYIE